MKDKRTQRFLILLCWLVYTCAYLGRYSYNANINLIMDDYGVTHAEAGLVTTFFFFSYGVGQVVNGFLCKYYPRRWMVPIVLIGSALINGSIYLGVPFAAIKWLWMINGVLQSCLWPTLVFLISRYLEGNYIRSAVLIMSTTTSTGTLVTYGCSALFVRFIGYRFAFLFGTLAPIAVAVMWIFLFRPGAEVEPVPPSETDDAPASPSLFCSDRLLYLVIVILGFFAVIDNFVKDGLQTWVPAILKENYGLPDELSIVLTLVLPILGIFGATFAVFLNKKVRGFVSLGSLLFAASAVCIGMILLTERLSVVAVLIFFGVVVMLMHAINNIITSMAPLYMRDRVNSGRLAGILNGCCYIGSTLSSYGLGAIADGAGWDAVFWLLLACVGVATVLGGVFALKKKI